MLCQGEGKEVVCGVSMSVKSSKTDEFHFRPFDKLRKKIESTPKAVLPHTGCRMQDPRCRNKDAWIMYRGS
jgi:hypothetical protein